MTDEYTIAVETTKTHKNWRLEIAFSNGMKIKAALNDLEEIAAAMDKAVEGRSGEVTGNEDWRLNIAKMLGKIFVTKLSSAPSEEVDLTPASATSLAAELRREHAAAWAALKP
jgi:hypothetical protein